MEQIIKLTKEKFEILVAFERIRGYVQGRHKSGLVPVWLDNKLDEVFNYINDN